jgi:AAA family ATP:ADP antiporter
VGLSFAVLVVVPTGAMLLLTQIVRRGGDYGLFKPAREMLFTVLSPESKFKSKSLMDTALSRGADSLGNGLYLLVAPLGLAGIAALSASACVLLTMGARWLGAAFADRESKGLRSR